MRHSYVGPSVKLMVLAFTCGLGALGACAAEEEGTPSEQLPSGGTTSAGDGGGTSTPSGGMTGTGTGGGNGLGASTSAGGTTSTPPYCDSQTKKELPFAVSSEFAASGWMGDHTDLASPEGQCPERPEGAVGDCYTFDYDPAGAEGWAGVMWQYPADNWGVLPGLCIAAGATKVTFWARGEAGDEVVSFAAAGSNLGDVTLTTEWVEYEILIGAADYNLSGDNGGVVAGFSWSAAGPEEAIRFYVDGIQWVNE